MLADQNKETAAVLMDQNNPLEIEFYFNADNKQLLDEVEHDIMN